MKIQGKIIKYGRENINTDEIIPARYLNTSDPDELAAHCMEDLDEGFLSSKASLGATVLVTGANMGCGSSREHAPVSIKHAGIKAIVAPSYARIFFRNAINTGLAIFECKDQSFFENAENGDDLVIDATEGSLENVSKGSKHTIQTMPSFLQELIGAGGLVGYAKKTLAK